MATPTNPVILSTDAYAFITSNNYPTMRTALGVGTTDSPTFSSINPSGNLTVRSNISLGYGTLTNTDTNLAIGNQPLHNLVTGSSSLVNAFNTAVGFRSLNSLLSGGSNSAVGGRSLGGILSGSFNTAVGLNAGYFTSNSTIVSAADNSIFIGTASRPLSSNQTDQIVIGREAIGLGSNTTVIGNSTTTETRLGGASNHAITTYGTYTNSTVFERLSLRYDTAGQSYIIGTQKGNVGGVARDLVFETDGVERARITAGGLFTANNVAVGRGGGNVLSNTAVGSGALVNNNNFISGNTAVGYLALSANRTGASNVAIGESALFRNTQGGQNVAIGSEALAQNTLGGDNIAIGKRALYFNAGGFFNTAVGSYALNGGTGEGNTAVGYRSLYSFASGNNNTAVGAEALESNSGTSNTAVGYSSLFSKNVGDQNTVIGDSVLVAVLTGSNNVAIGYNASTVNVLSEEVLYIDNSVIIGTNTKPLSTSGNTNSIIIGNTAEGLGSNTVVLGNDSITNTYLKGTVQLHRSAASLLNYDRLAMRWNGLVGTIGTSNLGTGVARDLVFETGGVERARITAGGLFTANNVAVGRGGGSVLTNTAVGSGALVNNIAGGVENTAVGYQALSANSDGAYNTAVGSKTLFKNTIGYDNVGVGPGALYSNTTGSYNAVVGSNALYSNTTGGNNIVMGYSSLVSNLTGSNNVALGHSAGELSSNFASVTDLSNSILIGTDTKPLSARGNTNSIVIGHAAVGKGSNTVVLGNDSITTTYLKGDIGIGADTFLVRDNAANTLALRNSTNSQTLNIYSTYTDSGNYQRLRITHNSITSEGSGSGTGTALSITGSFIYLLPGITPSTANRLVCSSSGAVGIGISTGSGAGAAPVVGTGKLNVNGDLESIIDGGGLILRAAGTSNRYRITLNAAGNALVFTLL